MQPLTTTALPTGTVTFLFTDIEGSTRMWEAHPRAMQAAVARHDALLREAIEAHGGYVFKTVGDAFCAAFPTAPQAIDAALAAQRALLRAEWDSTGPIKVRMALHTGVAELRDNDYFGLPLNRVARLLSTGHGGQILLSLATQQLVRDHLPPETSLKDLGEGGLKDLVRAEHVYQVVAPDLPSDFPPLRSLDTQYVAPGEAGGGVRLHNPYKGLRAFQESDAADFFGREVLIDRLVARMAEEGPLCRFLAVVGPSGSGKSSVVRAGVVPVLRRGRLPGSDRWLVVEMLPGAHPLEELEAVLLNVAVNPPASLMEQLQADERGLVRAVKRILPRDESIELVLVVDQFEEVFTLVDDEPTRVHFLESLHAAVTDPRSRLRVIVTLRADFFDRPLLYPDPGELMRQRTNVVLPLSAEELERAIVRPAEQMGVACEPELIAAIIKDVGEAPGALPLLQYALTELFERQDRQSNTMTLSAYRETGGVLGALARRADELYEGLSDEEKEATRQLFLRLITLGEGTEDTRRRVRRAELASIAGDAKAMDRVLDVFGRYRLLTFDSDPITKGPTVEVAHEALIRTWGKLKDWLEESRADLRLQRQLMAASGEWAQAKRDPSFLATGTRLAQFEALTGGAGRPAGVALTQEEREYLQASVEERGRQEKAEQQRQAHELELQKRAASRLRYLVAGLIVFLAIAAILTVWALGQSQVAQASAADANTQRQAAQSSAATAIANGKEADQQRQQAEANLNRSEALRLASEANRLLQAQGNSEVAALLSIQSLKRQYSPEADAALVAASTLNYAKTIFVGHTGAIWSVALSPDGKRVLTASDDKTARLWDARTGKELQRFTGHTDTVTSATFSPDGKQVLTESSDQTARLWDVATGRELHRYLGVYSAVLSPDGSQILAYGVSIGWELLDVSTGNQSRWLETNSSQIAAFSPDGSLVCTIKGSGMVTLWDARSGQQRRQFSAGSDYASIAGISPDNRLVLVREGSNAVAIWDAQTGKKLHDLGASQDYTVFDATFSPDGKSVATGGDDSVVRLWDVASGAELAHFSGEADAVLGVAFSPDGRYVLAGGGDKQARLWEIQTKAEYPSFHGSTNGYLVSPNGKYLVTVDRGLTSNDPDVARLWDLHSGAQLRQFTGLSGGVGGGDFSPDGKYLAASSSGPTANDQTTLVWNVDTGQELGAFREGGVAYAAEFTLDSKQLVTGSGDGIVRLWDVSTGAPIRHFFGHALPANWISFHRDGKRMLTSSTFSIGDKTAREWDLTTGKQLRQISPPGCEAPQAMYSPDGKYIAAACDDNTVRILDMQTANEIRRLVGHTGRANITSFSADGRYLYTSAADRTARMWDIQTGTELRRFDARAIGNNSANQAASFSPDGRLVVTLEQGTLRIWDGDYHQTINFVCAQLQRDLTPEERAQYEVKDNQPTCPKP